MKLALGTAQFGYNYGVSNKSGQTPLPEVKRILESAASAGVDLLDTAHHYREAESSLGSCDPLQKRFRIVTKTPAFRDLSLVDAGPELDRAFGESLAKLRLQSVYGLLFHSPKVLFDPQAGPVIAAARKWKAEGKVAKIGVSLYTPEEADSAAAAEWVDLIQAPFSLLDQRLHRSGALRRLADAGKEVHVRSLFLQGLLFLADQDLPTFFSPVRSELRQRRKMIEDAGTNLAAATFGFLAGFPEISRWVVGVNDASQLAELLRELGRGPRLDYAAFALTNELFLNPANWKLS